MLSLNYLMDHIIYQIFKNILRILLRNIRKIYVNRIKNHVVFEIKMSYKLELLSKEMSLLGSTKQDIDEDKKR